MAIFSVPTARCNSFLCWGFLAKRASICLAVGLSSGLNRLEPCVCLLPLSRSVALLGSLALVGFCADPRVRPLHRASVSPEDQGNQGNAARLATSTTGSPWGVGGTGPTYLMLRNSASGPFEGPCRHFLMAHSRHFECFCRSFLMAPIGFSRWPLSALSTGPDWLLLMASICPFKGPHLLLLMAFRVLVGPC